VSASAGGSENPYDCPFDEVDVSTPNKLNKRRGSGHS